MEFTPSVCQFAISAQDDGEAIKLPYGYHIEGDDRCPRNLPPELAELAQPNGRELCLLFNAVKCAEAFSEEKSCPVRRGKRSNSIKGKL